MEAMT